MKCRQSRKLELTGEAACFLFSFPKFLQVGIGERYLRTGLMVGSNFGEIAQTIAINNLDA
jgi:hypothetical protein